MPLVIPEIRPGKGASLILSVRFQKFNKAFEVSITLDHRSRQDSVEAFLTFIQSNCEHMWLELFKTSDTFAQSLEKLFDRSLDKDPNLVLITDPSIKEFKEIADMLNHQRKKENQEIPDAQDFEKLYLSFVVYRIINSTKRHRVDVVTASSYFVGVIPKGTLATILQADENVFNQATSLLYYNTNTWSTELYLRRVDVTVKIKGQDVKFPIIIPQPHQAGPTVDKNAMIVTIQHRADFLQQPVTFVSPTLPVTNVYMFKAFGIGTVDKDEKVFHQTKLAVKVQAVPFYEDPNKKDDAHIQYNYTQYRTYLDHHVPSQTSSVASSIASGVDAASQRIQQLRIQRPPQQRAPQVIVNEGQGAIVTRGDRSTTVEFPGIPRQKVTVSFKRK